MRKSIRTISVSAIALIVFATMPLFAQSKPKIAVYVASDELEEKEKRVVGTKILTAFVQSGQYTAIERGDAFLSRINRERQKQRDGSVDDNQISRLGKEAGVQYVCIADLIDAFGIYSLSARLINTETAEIVGIGEAEMKNLGELGNASDGIYKQITGKKISKKEQTTPVEPKYTFSEKELKDGDYIKNFSTSRRWATWGLNLFPGGLGSILLMDDWVGGVTQWATWGVYYVMYMSGGYERMYDCDGYATSYCSDNLSTYGVVAMTFGMAGLAHNIYRSISYDKPGSIDSHANSGFNFNILPTRRNEGVAFGLRYGVVF